VSGPEVLIECSGRHLGGAIFQREQVFPKFFVSVGPLLVVESGAMEKVVGKLQAF
jgi:hypothetical protein